VLEDHYTHGKLEGTRRICADGNLHTIAHYRNGLQQGETHLHHPNGILAATLPFRDGKLHGQASYFGQDGKLARKATYQAGKLHGKTISYYPDGAILSTEPYANDLLEGESKWLSPQGDVVKRTLFLQGKPASPTPATSQPKASTAPKRTLAIKPR
jgi:antitoxin component YwqK of YwqJK toxin-antitoxin module